MNPPKQAADNGASPMPEKEEEMAERYADQAFIGIKGVEKDKATYGKAYDTLMIYEAEDYVMQAYLEGLREGKRLGREEGAQAERSNWIKLQEEYAHLRQKLATAEGERDYLKHELKMMHGGHLEMLREQKRMREALEELSCPMGFPLEAASVPPPESWRLIAKARNEELQERIVFARAALCPTAPPAEEKP